MKARLAVLAALLAPAAHAATDQQNFSTIDRGRYLTIVGDCAACHTAPGGKPFAGGRPIATPFGKILAANITPDPQTGIGRLTDQQFVNALQRGLGRNGMHLYPAMPYTYTARVTRDDALAIRAYLATVAPVRNKVVEDQLPFPLSLRVGMLFWNLLFFRPGTYQPDARQSAEWNRGAYLVQGLAHCGMCHTPKNFLGGDHTAQALHGYRRQGWFAPDISPDPRRGLGNWSEADIVTYLRTGHNVTAGAAGPMAEEVQKSSQYFTDGDLHAIATYLKNRPSGSTPGTETDSPTKQQLQAGADIYQSRCSACHAPNGAGVPNLFPRLAGSPAVQSRDPTSTIRVILRGAHTAATKGAPTGPGMPSFAWALNDDQVAAIATYIRNAWNNTAPAVTPARVHAERGSLAQLGPETD